MITIFILFFTLCAALIAMAFSKKVFIRYLALASFVLLIVESLIFGYFLLLVYKGTCFFLIGNQKGLDALIKTRIVYATYFAQGRKSFINQLDNSLGYTLGENKTAGKYQTNNQGFRAIKDYNLHPDQNTLRMLALGDSFVFGDGERNEDSWPYILERSAENLEVLNFGVPGFGLGQSYLRYLKRGLRFNPDVIFLNYILVGDRDSINPAHFVRINDIRMAHFYRVRFWIDEERLLSKSVTPYDLFDPNFKAKHLYAPLGIESVPEWWDTPFFKKSNFGLLIKYIYMKEFFKGYAKDYEAKYTYSQRDEEINLKILENLLTSVWRNDATIIFYYDREFTELPDRIQSLLKKYDNAVVYINREKATQSPFVFEGTEQWTTLLNDTAHFNAKGNQYYAQSVLEILKLQNWGRGPRRFQYRLETNAFERIHMP